MEYSLAQDDFVGISFWLATAIMLASTVFFLAERDNVRGKWKTSLTVAALVTGVAFWHYLYMRGVWITTGDSPTVYRYIDWLITVPLQIVEFYLILAAVTSVSASLFWKLLVGSLVMLVGGYMGEAGYMAKMPAFVIGMAIPITNAGIFAMYPASPMYPPTNITSEPTSSFQNKLALTLVTAARMR